MTGNARRLPYKMGIFFVVYGLLLLSMGYYSYTLSNAIQDSGQKAKGQVFAVEKSDDPKAPTDVSIMFLNEGGKPVMFTERRSPSQPVYKIGDKVPLRYLVDDPGGKVAIDDGPKKANPVILYVFAGAMLLFAGLVMLR